MTHTSSRSFHLLHVEDDEAYSYLTQRLLKELRPNLTVHHAQNVEDALAQFGRRWYDLILLDLVMPSSSGLELLRTLKASPAAGGTPVVVLSSHRDQQHIWRAYQDLANAFVVKPESYEDLKAMLEALSDFWFGVALLRHKWAEPGVPPE